MVGPFGILILNDTSAVSGLDVLVSVNPAVMAVEVPAPAPGLPLTLVAIVNVGGGGGGFGAATPAATVAAVRQVTPTTASATERAEPAMREFPERVTSRPPYRRRTHGLVTSTMVSEFSGIRQGVTARLR